MFLLCLQAGFASSQETHQKFIGAEAGLTFIESEVPHLDYIRGDMPSYLGGYSTNSLTSLTYKNYVGVKPECFSLNNKFGITGGIRFSGITNSVGKNNYWVDNTNYFYFLYKQDGVNTEYLKVKEIIQTSYYLGIPVEIRFLPFNPHFFRFYCKLGAEINVRLQTKTDIVFNDNAMEIYQAELAKIVGKPNAFSLSAYGACGFKIGKESRPSVSVEASLPYIFLTPESSGLLNPMVGGGLQVNFQIPIKSNVQ